MLLKYFGNNFDLVVDQQYIKLKSELVNYLLNVENSTTLDFNRLA